MFHYGLVHLAVVFYNVKVDTHSSVMPNDADKVVDGICNGIRSSDIATALSVSSSQLACGMRADECLCQGIQSLRRSVYPLFRSAAFNASMAASVILPS